MKKRHRIGCLVAYMTDSQRNRYNDADLSTYDLRAITVYPPDEIEIEYDRDGNERSYRNHGSIPVSLRRATNPRLCPELAECLDGHSAELAE